MTTAVLGIDPGLDGALCYLNGPLVEIFAMPTYKINVNGKMKRRIDLYGLGDWLELRCDVQHAVVEDVHAMPGQGVTSMFSFGFAAGVVQMAAAAFRIPTKLIRPVDWKSRFGLLRQPKDASRAAASRLSPDNAKKWALAKDDGKAEAFLLAYYGAHFV